MTRFLVKSGLLLLILWAAAGVYLSDRALFERPESKAFNYTNKLGEEIGAQHPIAFLMTFDEPDLREWISGAEIIATGVEAAPGRHGLGRRFTGTRWSMIHTPINWLHIGRTYTISMWIKLLPPSGKQDILYSFHQQRHTGLRLEDGELTFHIPAPGYLQTISYPFTAWGRFVHIAAVADPESGIARLYENGRLMAEGPIDTVDFPSHNIEFGTRRWYATRDPLHAVLDETVIWNQALSEKDILQLYHTRRSILAHLDPAYYRKWQWAQRIAQRVKTAVHYIDYFNPRLHQGRIQAADIPEIQLVLRKRHQHHFNRSHHHSLQSGRRTADAAAFQPINFIFDGVAARGELALDGNDQRYGRSMRPAYILDTRDNPILDMHSVRLVPPEDIDVQSLLLDTRVARHLRLPHTKNGLCRLIINGQFAGVYYFEDDSRRAVSPDASRDYMRGPGSTVDWPFLFRRPAPFFSQPRGPARHDLPLSDDVIEALYEEVTNDILPLLINDPFATRSSREIRYRLRADKEDILSQWSPAETGSPADQAAQYLSPFMLLGGNPSPQYIHEDLDLDVLPFEGLSIEWSSSEPGLLAADGRVTLPDGDVPQAVTLTARIEDGRHTAERTFEFRVMPKHFRLPAFMLYVDDALQKNRRVDCRVEHYVDATYEPERHRAFHGTRAGVKFRGNSSFWQRMIHDLPDFSLRKMGMSLRFEEPHRLLNETRTRHLYFATGYSDTSLLRNKLSYDLFKEMATEETPRFTPDVQWTEVFINGHFQGLFEFNTRIDRHKLGFGGYDESQPQPAVLYKFEQGGRNFASFLTRHISQKRPPRFYGPHWGPYEEMTDWVSHVDRDTFAREAEDVFDVDHIIDYHLLLNITENTDGINVNLYVARDASPSARFFIVPWDYDKTMDPFTRRGQRWYSNGLTSRLSRHLPGYDNRLYERWATLREGPWSDEALRERIDTMQQQIEGYIQWDYRHWNDVYSKGIPFDEQTQRLVDRLMQRVAFLDQHLARMGDMADEADEEGAEREDDG